MLCQCWLLIGPYASAARVHGIRVHYSTSIPTKVSRSQNNVGKSSTNNLLKVALAVGDRLVCAVLVPAAASITLWCRTLHACCGPFTNVFTHTTLARSQVLVQVPAVVLHVFPFGRGCRQPCITSDIVLSALWSPLLFSASGRRRKSARASTPRSGNVSGLLLKMTGGSERSQRSSQRHDHTLQWNQQQQQVHLRSRCVKRTTRANIEQKDPRQGSFKS